MRLFWLVTTLFQVAESLSCFPQITTRVPYHRIAYDYMTKEKCEYWCDQMEECTGYSMVMVIAWARDHCVLLGGVQIVENSPGQCTAPSTIYSKVDCEKGSSPPSDIQANTSPALPTTAATYLFNGATVSSNVLCTSGGNCSCEAGMHIRVNVSDNLYYSGVRARFVAKDSWAVYGDGTYKVNLPQISSLVCLPLSAHYAKYGCALPVVRYGEFGEEAIVCSIQFESAKLSASTFCYDSQLLTCTTNGFQSSKGTETILLVRCKLP